MTFFSSCGYRPRPSSSSIRCRKMPSISGPSFRRSRAARNPCRRQRRAYRTIAFLPTRIARRQDSFLWSDAALFGRALAERLALTDSFLPIK